MSLFWRYHEENSGSSVSITGSGGITYGGEATIGRTRVVVGSGGIVFSGSAVLARIRAVTGSGGITFSGVAGLARVRAVLASGGITYSGNATISRARAVLGSGGILYGGAATLARIRAIAGSGGIVFSGAASVARTAAVTGSGGINFAGSPVIGRTAAVAGSGGIQFSGTGSPQGSSGGSTVSITGSGGINYGGAATIGRTATVIGSGGIHFGGTGFVTAPPVTRNNLVFSRRSPVGKVVSITGSVGIKFGGGARFGFTRAVVGSGGIQFGGSGKVRVLRANVLSVTAPDTASTVLPDVVTDQPAAIQALDVPQGTRVVAVSDKSPNQLVTPERRALAVEIEKEEEEAASVITEAAAIDWSIITKDLPEPTTENARGVILEVGAMIRASGIQQQIEAAIINGQLIALLAKRKSGVPIIGRIRPALFTSHEDIFTPEGAVRYWKERIPLTDEQAAQLLVNLNAFHATTLAIQGELTQAVLKAVSEVFAKAIAEGMTLAQFRQLFSEVIPGRTKAAMETIFRTNISKAYSQQRLLDIRESIRFTPFIQYFAINDDRARATHRAMSGYIAAADDPIWDEWTPPNGFNCRCVLSPIGFAEAIRRGIAEVSPDRRTLTFPRGPRPFGDPPAYVFDPKKKAMVRVIPDIGFGNVGAVQRVA